MKVLVITGTPGTGKTVLAKKIAESLKFYYLDVNKVIKKYKLSEGYDKKRQAKVIDTKKLNEVLINTIKNFKKSMRLGKENKTGIIIDSHLSHYLPKKYVDLCIVTKCGLKKLRHRLFDRNYPEKKIRENLDCEIFDVCLNEASKNRYNISIVDTTKGININTISQRISDIIDLKKG